MAKAGTLRVNIVGDSGPLEKTLKGTGTKLGGFAKTVGKVAVGVGAIGAAAAVGGAKLVKETGELEAVARKAGTVFEDSFGDVDAWARESAGAMGLTSSELTGLTANFADLLKPMGFTAAQAADMAMETNELSGALAEWSGGTVDAAGASEILAKAMLGEREGLKQLGISINEADVKARLAANGQDQLTGAALEQAKALATQQLIMEKSVDAQTAYAEGGDTLQRKQAEVTAAFKQFKDDALVALMPAAQALATWAADTLPPLMDGLSELFTTKVVPAFRALSDWWEANGPGIVAAAQALWDGLQPIFGAVIDLWNTLVGMFQSGGEDTNKVFAEVQAFAGEVWPQIQAIIGSAMDAIQAVVERITAIVKGVWERWGADILDFALTVWNAIKDVIGGVLEVIQGIWETFAGLFSGDWERMWEGVKQIASGLWDVIGGLWDLALANMTLLVTVFKDTVTELWGKLWDWVKDTASEAWDNLKEGVSDGVDDVIGFFRDLPGDMLSALGNLHRILLNAGRTILQGLWDGMKEKWDQLTGWIGGLGGRMRDLKGPIEKDRVLLTDIGEEIIGGLGRGMDKEWSNVEKKLGMMTANIPLTVSSNAGRYRTSGMSPRPSGSSDETNRLLRELLAEMRRGGDVYLDGDKVGRTLVTSIRSTQGGWR